jgi:hypothetical protein
MTVPFVRQLLRLMAVFVRACAWARTNRAAQPCARHSRPEVTADAPAVDASTSALSLAGASVRCCPAAGIALALRPGVARTFDTCL